MAAPAPLTVQLPPLQELSCEMCGTNYEDRGDGAPYCGFSCATGTGDAPPAAQPTWGWALRVPPPAAQPTLGWAQRALPPPPAAETAAPTSEDAIGCYFCGAPVSVTGPCEPCLRALQEDERQAEERCGDCRFTLYECRCHEDDYPEDEDDEPPGRICPICGDRFEGNEWFGVCSRRCARRDR